MNFLYIFISTVTVFISLSFAQNAEQEAEFAEFAALLRNETDRLEKLFLGVEQNLASAKLEHNFARFDQILDSIRKIKTTQLYPIESDLHRAISTVHTGNFIGHLELQTDRIKVRKTDQALNWIAHEILGYQANISGLVSRVYSEKIEMILKLEEYKYEHIVESAKLAHSLIAVALAKPRAGAESQKEIQEITVALDHMAGNATNFKSQLVNVLQEQMEALELDSKDLNLVQKYEVSGLISVLGYMVQYVSTYRELIKELL